MSFPDMTKDYWLIVAFRRLVVESFIRESLGHAHLACINWLRLELLARLVELGFDTHPLSSEYDEESKRSPNNW